MRLETLHLNGFDIVLPIGLEETMNTPVRDSYQSFLKTSTNDVRRHLTCLTTLLPPEVKGMWKPNVLHAFGGLGASAQVLNQACELPAHEFWERDPTCVEYLRRYYNNVVHAQNSMKWLATEDLGIFNIILLDMSVGTIKTPLVKEMWQNVAQAVAAKPSTVVWFTDTACHKIHLNYRSYEKDFGEVIDKTPESYLNAYSIWLEHMHNLTITAAMREAGEIYAVVRHANGRQRFKTIPYV